MIPRGKYIGQRQGVPVSEVENFMKCEDCGAYFDMRDLGQVAAHIGPHTAPPSEDSVQ
jgi:hypothetical protein